VTNGLKVRCSTNWA